jgi:hypothetical protein
VKLYQLHRIHEAGESAGYEYFSSKREAAKAASEWRKSTPGPDDDHETEIKEIEVTPTKAGILAALNRYGKHNDNG